MGPFEGAMGAGIAEDQQGSVGNLLRSRERALKIAPPSYPERVKQALADAEQRAADLRRVDEILSKNPELEELLSILMRTHI